MEDENYFNSHEESMIVYESTTFIIHHRKNENVNVENSNDV
jgi:hypothetical protein